MGRAEMENIWSPVVEEAKGGESGEMEDRTYPEQPTHHP